MVPANPPHINILTTLLAKKSGDVRVLNHELGREDDKIRQGIGVVFQNSVLDDLLTVKENLTMRGLSIISVAVNSKPV